MTRANAESQFARMREIARHGPPLDADERAEFESAKARVRAEDERRRQPEPQLELGEAA